MFQWKEILSFQRISHKIKNLETFVFHSPFKFDHDRLSSQIVQERLGVNGYSLQATNKDVSEHRSDIDYYAQSPNYANYIKLTQQHKTMQIICKLCTGTLTRSYSCQGPSASETKKNAHKTRKTELAVFYYQLTILEAMTVYL